MPTSVMKNGGVEICREDERLLMGTRVVFKEDDDEREKRGISCSDESSSSSIGKNSDDLSQNSIDKSQENGEEVQSSYKDAIEALEEVLPIRRGISRFYTGKSKSFTSLADASSSSSSSSSSSLKHISKPDDPYSRRRRNLLSYGLTWEKNRAPCLRSNGGSGISKRVTTSNRKTKLALAVAMSNSGSSNKKQVEGCNSSAASFLLSSPGNDFSSWRSFSLADLQQCTNPDQ